MPAAIAPADTDYAALVRRLGLCCARRLQVCCATSLVRGINEFKPPISPENPVYAGAVLRRLRRRGRLTLSGPARGQILLVPDLARAAGGVGAELAPARCP